MDPTHVHRWARETEVLQTLIKIPRDKCLKNVFFHSVAQSWKPSFTKTTEATEQRIILCVLSTQQPQKNRQRQKRPITNDRLLEP